MDFYVVNIKNPKDISLIQLVYNGAGIDEKNDRRRKGRL